MVADRFCYGEVSVYARNNVLNTSSSSIIESFYPSREDYDRLFSAAQCAYMAEKLASNRPNDELFSLLYHTLSFIAYGEASPKDLELCFAAKYVKTAGYEPVLTRCTVCGKPVTAQHSARFSLPNGGTVCDECAGEGRTYSALALEAFRRMLLLDNTQLDRVRLPEEARRELDTLIYDYAEYVLEQPLKLRQRKGAPKKDTGNDTKRE